MVFIPEERTKQKMMKDGSVQKFIISGAGAGIGMMAGGAVLVGAGILLTVFLLAGLDAVSSIAVGMIFDVPGLLLIIIGIWLKNRRLKNYRKIISESSGLPEEEVARADEEFKNPQTMIMTIDKGQWNRGLKNAGFITEHYVRFPGIAPLLFRIEDLAACFYTKKFPCGDGGYGNALVAYGTNRDGVYDEEHSGCLLMSGDEAACQAIVEAVASKNPAVITGHFFTFEGKRYDALKNKKEVAALYQWMCRQQRQSRTDGK